MAGIGSAERTCKERGNGSYDGTKCVTRVTYELRRLAEVSEKLLTFYSNYFFHYDHRLILQRM